MNNTPPFYPDRSNPRIGPFVFLGSFWVVSALILSLPVAGTFTINEKIATLLPALIVSIIVTIANPKEGFTIWAFGLTVLVTQTGFQATIGNVTTSVLELLIIVLILLLVFLNRTTGTMVHLRDLPGYKWLLVFITYSLFMLLIGMIRGDSFENAIIELKGFVLYPLLIYLMMAGVHSKQLINWLIGYAVLWYSYIAVIGIRDLLTHSQVVQSVTIYRASGEYAAINVFGSASMAMGILVLSLAVGIFKERHRLKALALIGISAVLIVGGVASVSRTAILGLVIGLLVIAVSNKWKSITPLLIISLVFIGVLYLVPQSIQTGIADRLFQVTDSSSVKRIFYLESGWKALQVYWPVGAGWGNGFFYYDYTGLVQTGFVPWYHNDYLNLAVQIGLPGLIMYLGFWISILGYAIRWIRTNKGTKMAPYVIGGFAALSALLAGAFFEHFLWRSDMGGFVFWIASLLFVSSKIPQSKAR